MNEIKHIRIPIEEIILLEENPREISDAELKKLADDIKSDPSFLHQRPSLINLKDGSYYCYAGTQRIKAQKLLGESHAICFVEKNSPLKTQRERMLRDNLHRGKWDANKLMDLDFDINQLEDIGFDFDELNIDTDLLEEPTDLTSEMKNNPPSIKIVFQDEKQMSEFIKILDILYLDVKKNPKFEGVSYSVSLGEL